MDKNKKMSREKRQSCVGKKSLEKSKVVRRSQEEGERGGGSLYADLQTYGTQTVPATADSLPCVIKTTQKNETSNLVLIHVWHLSLSLNPAPKCQVYLGWRERY